MLNENRNFTIKSWEASDRPREKLMEKGVSELSNAELLAILIGSGNRNLSAVELSKRILASNEFSLNKLSKKSIDDLMSFDGVGEAKACSIVTALELGKRFASEQGSKIIKITCSKDVYDVMQPKIGPIAHEEFWVLFLNNSNKILQKLQLSKGGLTGTVVDIRLILKKALELMATGIILCHNHPSGNLSASQADKQITEKLKVASETMDIKILDHIIITEKAYFSFADEGILF
jgi:DNA repair protein RadC